jgi:hypothetical protein
MLIVMTIPVIGIISMGVVRMAVGIMAINAIMVIRITAPIKRRPEVRPDRVIPVTVCVAGIINCGVTVRVR